MREMREGSRLTRMGRRLSLILSKESIFGTPPTGTSSPKMGREKSGSLPSSPDLNPAQGFYRIPDNTPPANPACKVFGVDLQAAVQKSNTSHKMLPDVMYKCFTYLDDKAVAEEGIFRLSGSATDILRIKGQFNTGCAYDLNTCLNPHTVSGLLKLFLRELPHPLFPTEIDTVEGDLLGRIKTMVGALPAENRCLMSCLFWLLHKISKAEAVTKMGTQNLVIVFSATLNCSGAILTKIIKHAMDIFPENALQNTGVTPDLPAPAKNITLVVTPDAPKSTAATAAVSVTPAKEEEDDIFLVKDKSKADASRQISNNSSIPAPKTQTPTHSIEIGRRGGGGFGSLRRTLTRSIFDADDEDDASHNDLLITPLQSLPVRTGTYFM